MMKQMKKQKKCTPHMCKSVHPSPQHFAAEYGVRVETGFLALNPLADRAANGKQTSFAREEVVFVADAKQEMTECCNFHENW